MNVRFAALALLCLPIVTGAAPDAAEPLSPPMQAWFPNAPPLPKPEGQIIRVSSVEELFQAAGQVKPGGTILVADGHYMMPRYFQ